MLREMLVRHEGLRKKAYKCSKGKWTIGIGHNIDANPLPADMKLYLAEHGELSDELIDRLFEADVAIAERGCRILYPGFDSFSENRRNALIDLMFNMGLGSLQKFHVTNSLINKGDWSRAADNLKLSLYYRQLGGDPPGTDDGREERPEEICRLLRDG